MPSFSDSIFLFVLALLLFGPKRLPVLARELGKWVGEFRRASNEFKMQMEEELRVSEQTERKKQIAAMEAAAPVAPPIEEHKVVEEHKMEIAAFAGTGPPAETDGVAEMTVNESAAIRTVPEAIPAESSMPERDTTFDRAETVDGGPETMDGVRSPLPIATSGEMRLMPPETGLPVRRSRAGTKGATGDVLEELLGAIPVMDEETIGEETIGEETISEASGETAAEATAHGR